MNAATAGLESHVHIAAGSVSLGAMLTVPSEATRIVVFAHASGTSRFSPRNIFIAEVLRAHSLGILLMDLLTANEELSRAKRFDIDLMADRLSAVHDWLKRQQSSCDLSIGLFGASTGAAAAFKVAAGLGKEIGAVVSRGGRPDLAEEALPKVICPTLLVVGGNDPATLKLNETAFERMTAIKKIEIISSATHLFEEPGALEQVAYLASAWFTGYL